MNFRPWQMILFAVVAIAIFAGYTAIENHYFPKPNYLTAQQKAEVREGAAPLAALPLSGTIGDAWQIALNEKMRQTPLKEREELALAQAEAKKTEEQAK